MQFNLDSWAFFLGGGGVKSSTTKHERHFKLFLKGSLLQ